MKTHITNKSMILVALLFLAMGTLKAQTMVDGWKPIVTGAEGNLYDICCINADNIWVCSQDGGLLKSSDGGETWVRKHTEAGFAMSQIKFANESVGYAVGVHEIQHERHKVLLKTLDAGETWTRVADTALEAVSDTWGEWRFCEWQLIGTDTLYFFEARDASEPNLGYAYLYRSTDGGYTFEALELPYESIFEYRSARPIGLHFEDNDGYCVYRGVAVGNPYLAAFRTTDYGQTWTRHILMDGSGPFQEYNQLDYDLFNTARLHVLNHSEARLFYDWGYYDTEDGFASFSNVDAEPNEDYLYTGFYDDPYDLKFTDAIHGCATHMSGIVIKDDPRIGNGVVMLTDDGGETWRWSYRGVLPGRLLFSVDGVDTTFYITSESGVVYKRCLIEVAAVDEETLPMTELTVIPSLTDGVVRIGGIKLREATVYNTLGQLVFTHKEDTGAMTIDLGNQPSGLYMIAVTDANGRRCVRKVVKQ